MISWLKTEKCWDLTFLTTSFHQIFGQALQSVNESVRFSDETFHGEFCLSENRTNIFGVKDERFFFGRALARAKDFFRKSDEVKSTLK